MAIRPNKSKLFYFPLKNLDLQKGKYVANDAGF